MRFNQTAPQLLMAAMLLARVVFAVDEEPAGRFPIITGSPTPVPIYQITSAVDGFGSAFALLDDVNGDSVEEMAVGSSNVNGGAGAVLLYDGATGTLIRTVSAPGGGVSSFSSQLFKWRDMSGDGISELLIWANASGRGVLYVLDPVTGELPQSIDFGPALPAGQQPTWFHKLADIDGDSVEDLFVWSADSALNYRFFLFSGSDFTLIAPGIVPPPEGPPHWWLHPSAIQVPDVSGDSVPDLLISYLGDSVDGVDLAGRLYLYETVSGNIIREITETPPRQDGYLLARAVAGDVTGDGYPEVVLGSGLCTDPSGPLLVNLVDGSFPARLPPVSYSHCTYAWSVNLAPDFNGDSGEDLVVNSRPEDLAVFSGADLSVLSRINSSNASQYEYTQGLVGPDIDMDGVGEIVALSFTVGTSSSYTRGGHLSLFRRYRQIWSSGTLAFGSVERTAPGYAEQSTTLYSTGSLPLRMMGTEIVGADASEFRVIGPEVPFIAGSDQRDYKVRFEPTTVGVKDAELRVHSNDPLTPVLAIKLTAISYDQLVGSGTGVLFAQAGGYSIGNGVFIYAVDLATGDRSIVSSTSIGSGPFGSPPGGIVVESPDTLVAVMGGSLYRVDRSTGNRTALSTPTHGVGPSITYATGLARDGEGSYILVGDSSILKVDPQTGDRTLIAGTLGPGEGPSLQYVRAPVVYPDGAIYVCAAGLILRVDPSTGDRSLFGGTHVYWPADLDVLPDGDFHCMHGSSFTTRVNNFDGFHTLLTSSHYSDGFIGNGRPLQRGGSAAVAPSSGQLYVYDTEDGSIYRIDQANGNRWLVSSASERGTGPALPYYIPHAGSPIVYLAIDETPSSAGHWNQYE